MGAAENSVCASENSMSSSENFEGAPVYVLRTLYM